MAKIFRYHLIDSKGKYIEKNIPEYDQALTIQRFLFETQNLSLDIQEEHVPQLKGGKLGRDPDLH